MKQESLPKDTDGSRVYYVDIAIATGAMTSKETVAIDVGNQIPEGLDIISVRILQDLTNPGALAWFEGYWNNALMITNNYVGSFDSQTLYVRLYHIK